MPAVFLCRGKRKTATKPFGDPDLRQSLPKKYLTPSDFLPREST